MVVMYRERELREYKKRSAFADNIIWLRKEKKLTQEQMAEKIGVTKVTVINWEKGRNFPCDYNLCQIAQVFNVKVGDLTNK